MVEMTVDQKIIDIIIDIAQSYIPKTENGFFKSEADKALRCIAVDEMFRGLQRENQDKVLRFMLDIMLKQNQVAENTLLKRVLGCQYTEATKQLVEFE